MFVFYSVHDPQPEKEELWVQKMHQFDELMKQQPGILFVSSSCTKSRRCLWGAVCRQERPAYRGGAPGLERDGSLWGYPGQTICDARGVEIEVYPWHVVFGHQA